MQQISLFETLKPRIVLLKDESYLHPKLVTGAEFELYMETEEHYIIFLDDTFYGIYKRECKKI